MLEIVTMRAPQPLLETASGHRRSSLAAVMAVILAGCGTQPIVRNADFPPPPDRALIQGTSSIGMFAHVVSFIKSVDGKPAGAYACGRELKSSDFWSGPEYGGWVCADPSRDAAAPTSSTVEMNLGTAQPLTPHSGPSLLVGVAPGPHDIVVVRDVASQIPCGLANCGYNPVGDAYRAELSMTAEAGHMYLVHTEASGDQYLSWIVDKASGVVVAGQAPQQ
jgi:hypothetical protein